MEKYESTSSTSNSGLIIGQTELFNLPIATGLIDEKPRIKACKTLLWFNLVFHPTQAEGLVNIHSFLLPKRLLFLGEWIITMKNESIIRIPRRIKASIDTRWLLTSKIKRNLLVGNDSVTLILRVDYISLVNQLSNGVSSWCNG